MPLNRGSSCASACLAPTAIALSVLATCVLADEVYLGAIPVRGVTVLNVQGGEVIYEENGRERRRPIEDVHLALDAIPELIHAEQAIEVDDFEDAEHLFQLALALADEPWQQSWILFRLTSEYDNRGHYVQAVGSWAQLIQVSEDRAWSEVAPICPPDLPETILIESAIQQLNKAKEAVRSVHLRPLIDGYLGDLRAILTKAEAIADGPSDEDAQGPPPINDPKTPADEDGPAKDADDGDETEAGEDATDPARSDVSAAIDQLIEDGQWSEARQRIETLARRPRAYPLDRLLYQYGLVLRHDGQYRDAAVRFMQCAILFENGDRSIQSLIETARIYRDHLGGPEVAKRLLERARDLAVNRDETELVQSIDAELAL